MESSILVRKGQHASGKQHTSGKGSVLVKKGQHASGKGSILVKSSILVESSILVRKGQHENIKTVIIKNACAKDRQCGSCVQTATVKFANIKQKSLFRL